MINTKTDTGLVHVIHIPAAEQEQAFSLILGISKQIFCISLKYFYKTTNPILILEPN